MNTELFSGFANNLSALMRDVVKAYKINPDGSLRLSTTINGSLQESFLHSEGRFLLKNTDYLATSDAILYMPYNVAALESGVIWKINDVLYYPIVDTIDQANVKEMVEVAVSKPRKVASDLLTFKTPGVMTQDPVSLNQYLAPGVDFTVSVRIRATEDQGIRDYLGADQTDLAVVGFWGAYNQPSRMPANVTYRTPTELSISGQVGSLEIMKGLPLELQHKNLATVFGQGFTGIWKAH
jgi:hypothetical protein